MKRRQPEKEIQAQIVTLLRSLRADVWVLGTRRPRGDYQGTRQSPGLPDLIAFLPDEELLFIEVKSPKGRLTEEQKQFQQCCFDARVSHIVGGIDEVIDWLIDRRYLLEDQVSHERRSG